MISTSSVRGLVAAAVLAGAAAFASSAGAAQCSFGASPDDPDYADVWASTDCVGEIEGENDSASFLNSFGTDGMFGISNWTQDSRYEGDDGSYDPDGILNVFNVATNMLSGEWSVDSWDGVGAAVLVIKASNSFAAYLLDLTSTAGGWTTAALETGNNRRLMGGNQPAISHISLYVSPAPIPLPATGLLLVGALAGLGLMRRKRAAA